MSASDERKATLQAVLKSGNKDKLGICSRVMLELPPLRPTTIIPANTDYTTYQAFAFTQGNVPIDTIVLHEDGSVDI